MIGWHRPAIPVNRITKQVNCLLEHGSCAIIAICCPTHIRHRVLTHAVCQYRLICFTWARTASLASPCDSHRNTNSCQPRTCSNLPRPSMNALGCQSGNHQESYMVLMPSKHMPHQHKPSTFSNTVWELPCTQSLICGHQSLPFPANPLLQPDARSIPHHL